VPYDDSWFIIVPKQALWETTPLCQHWHITLIPKPENISFKFSELPSGNRCPRATLA